MSSTMSSEEHKITDAELNTTTINQDDPEKGTTDNNNNNNNNNNNDVPSEATDQDGGLIVYWEHPENEDPENPLNWTDKRKWSMIGILSFLSLLVPLASSMLAPGVPQVLEEFDITNNQLATFVVSVFILGFALGPIVIAPLSEVYGRNMVYHVCNATFTVFTIACALATNMGMLIAFRFLAGFSGVAVLTIGSGSIVDMMPANRRGRAMALWTGGPILGPVVGPICGGFLVEDLGWRWVFWVIAIASGVTTLASVFILKESYAPLILERKAAKLRKETGNPGYQSKLKSSEPPKKLFARSIVRPMKLLFTSPLVTILSTYVAIIYGLMYILFTTFTFVFEEYYGFSARSAGLVFLGGGIGNILGQFLVGFLSDRLIEAEKAKGNQPQPEIRLSLWITVPSALTLSSGLLIYGWGAQYHVHWIVPIFGTGIMGFGLIGIFMSILTYLVEVYQEHAASVTAANAVFRSVLGAVLPLIGLQMYDALGLGWGNTLLGLICFVLAPTTWIMAIYGTRIRQHPGFVNKP